MPDRLQVHGATTDLYLDDAGDVTIDSYIVWDHVAGVCRRVALTARDCERWIESFSHRYPDPDDEDGLS